jgi:hypothetical protein
MMVDTSNDATLPKPDETCNECSKTLTSSDRVLSGGRVFCRSCYASLRTELQRAITTMSQDINYGTAAFGAILGGVLGALVWWGFTVLTHISFGLVAVAIGFLVAKGAMAFTGGKRSTGLQTLSIVVSLASYVCASYLVNMTFINKSLAEKGDTFRLGFPPPSLDLFFKVVTADVGLMDIAFLAIVIFEAWRIPKPFVIPPEAA